MTKMIGLITSVLVLALAVAAFVLSYDALRGLAADNGVSLRLAWIWPFVIDGFLIVASLSVLRNGLLGERALYQWALVALFTAASIAFNIAHAPEDLLARVMGATPPVALALAFELLMGQVKSEVGRGRAVNSLEKITSSVNELRGERERIVNEIERRREELEEVECERSGNSREFGQIQQELDKANLTRSEQAELAMKQLLTFYRENPGAAQSDAGEYVDRSRSWVSKTLAELEESGLIKRNGKGVQVVG